MCSDQPDNIEQLLVKARFEEAKQVVTETHSQMDRRRGPPPLRSSRNLPRPWQSGQRGPHSISARSTQTAYPNPSYQDKLRSNRPGPLTCFNCGGTGHFAKDCKWRTTRTNEESRGRPIYRNQTQRMSALTAKGRQDTDEKNIQDSSLPEERVAQLRDQLRKVELEAALHENRATLHGISAPNSRGDIQLGPSINAEIELEGMPVQALLDTGSPATIVSLELVLQALWRKRPTNQTREQWEEDMKKRIEAPSIMLQNYGGDTINTVGQILVP